MNKKHSSRIKSQRNKRNINNPKNRYRYAFTAITPLSPTYTVLIYKQILSPTERTSIISNIYISNVWIWWSFVETEISFDSSHTSSPKFRPVFQLLEQGKECSTSLKGEGGCWQPQKTGDIWYGSQAWISRPPLGFSYLTIINRLRVTHVLVKYVRHFKRQMHLMTLFGEFAQGMPCRQIHQQYFGPGSWAHWYMISPISSCLSTTQ